MAAVVEEKHHEKRTRSDTDPQRDWPLRARKKQRQADVAEYADAKSDESDEMKSSSSHAEENDAAIAATLAEIFEEEDGSRRHRRAG